MSAKQDRQGARTPANLEQKYNFGKVFSRLDSENKEQNLTMRQFAELMVETIATMQRNITGLNESVKTLEDKDTQIEQEMEKSETALDNKIATYWKTIYPVGSIYVSVSSTSPATLFGGTWTQIKDTFLLASGSTYTAGSTGGEATHKLTTSEMPSHKHSALILLNQTGYSNTSKAYEAYLSTVPSETSTPIASTGGTAGTLTGMNTRNLRDTGATGSGNAHNNMPPYLAVYVWKRTE